MPAIVDGNLPPMTQGLPSLRRRPASAAGPPDRAARLALSLGSGLEDCVLSNVASAEIVQVVPRACGDRQDAD